MKISQVQKITLSALFLALTIILTRITPLQNIPVIPWIRISLGPALIIFSSLLLGPIYGAIVGALSDILGIVLFPNALGYGINPLFTFVYGLLGILPWMLFWIVKKIKKPQISGICMTSAGILIFATATYLFFFNPIILENYEFELWLKILIISLIFVLFVGTTIAIFFIDKYFNNKYSNNHNTFNIAFVCFISELLLMLLLNSLVKTITFEVNFWIIFFAQAIVFFVDVPLNTFVVEGLLFLVSKSKIVASK